MDIIQPLAAICLVMALLGGVLLLLKKRGASSFRLPLMASAAPRRLELVERLALGPQHALHLVRAGDKLVMVTTAPGFCQVADHSFSSGDKA
jgi:hypothetical protein